MVKEQLLMELARRALKTVKTVPIGLGTELVYVMESAGGSIYTVINDDFEGLLKQLADSGDTRIVQVLAMFAPGRDVDIPSCRFRKALLALNGANARTEVILQSRIMALEDTLPESPESFMFGR